MKLVIFDCDGTLVDSQNGIVAAMDHAFATLALPPPTRDATLSVVGLSLPEAFSRLAGSYPIATQRELARIYRTDFLSIKQRVQCAEPLFPGIGALIASLRQRDDVVLAIATGKSQRGVARILERELWHGVFATIQTADENPSKPDPGMIMAALRATGADPKRSLMIGDTSYDMEMAANAGVTGVGVTWGYHNVATLRSAGARHIADHTGRVQALIDALPGQADERQGGKP